MSPFPSRTLVLWASINLLLIGASPAQSPSDQISLEFYVLDTANPSNNPARVRIVN